MKHKKKRDWDSKDLLNMITAIINLILTLLKIWGI